MRTTTSLLMVLVIFLIEPAVGAEDPKATTLSYKTIDDHEILVDVFLPDAETRKRHLADPFPSRWCAHPGVTRLDNWHGNAKCISTPALYLLP